MVLIDELSSETRKHLVSPQHGFEIHGVESLLPCLLHLSLTICNFQELNSVYVRTWCVTLLSCVPVHAAVLPAVQQCAFSLQIWQCGMHSQKVWLYVGNTPKCVAREIFALYICSPTTSHRL